MKPNEDKEQRAVQIAGESAWIEIVIGAHAASASLFTIRTNRGTTLPLAELVEAFHALDSLYSGIGMYSDTQNLFEVKRGIGKVREVATGREVDRMTLALHFTRLVNSGLTAKIA